MSTKRVRTSTRARRRWQNHLRDERRIERGFGIRHDVPVPDILKGLVREKSAPEDEDRPRIGLVHTD
jgi:hypothetical protein